MTRATKRSSGEAVTGYLPALPIEIVFPGEVPEGQTPFTALIPSDLAFGELAPLFFEDADEGGPTMDHVHAALAPHVVGWNLLQRNQQTGEVEPVPPPAEAGPDAFKLLPKLKTLWLLNKVRFGPLALPDPKASTAFGSTDAPPSDDDSASE